MKKVIVFLFLALICLSFSAFAIADAIVLPVDLVRIESESFAGIQVDSIEFPSGLEYIADDAFVGAHFVGTGAPNTYAETWCTEHGFEYYPFFTIPEYFEWETINNTEAKINKYNGPDEKVYIPSVIEDYQIVEIADEAFVGNTHINYVYIPASVRQIGKSAFNHCDSLQQIIFSEGLQIIRAEAFKNCTALTNAILPDSVNGIGEHAFYGCVNLESFRYPLGLDHVISLHDNGFLYEGAIFKDCKKLTSIDVPEGITFIPAYFFANSNYLTNVNLPSTLNQIRDYAFWECASMSTILFPAGLNEIYKSAFNSCTALNDLTFPEGLQIIRAEAFKNCTALTNAILPDSVNGIGEHAFYGCVNLESFRYPLGLDHVISLHDNGFLYEGAIFKDCKKLTSIDVPEGITKIPAAMFQNCNYLQSVTLPSTLTTLEDGTYFGGGVFSTCSSLEYIYIGNQVTTIPKYTFENCPILTVECEYGSVALAHCMENNIAYFYLSLTNASRPSGTLYNGETFALYGYVRSSEPVSSVTATIYSKDKKEVIQTVTVTPEVLNYNLSGTVNANMQFAKLELGHYCYTLKATAGEKTEVFQDTTFSIVPPPLRMYISGLSVPEGLLQVNSDFEIAGTVISNYTISNLNVIVYNRHGAPVLSYSNRPLATSVDLASAKSLIDISELPEGEYTFVVSATANGITKNLAHNVFILGDPSVNISPEDINALVSFAREYKNILLLDYSYYNTLLGNMGAREIARIAINSRNQLFIGQLKKWLLGENTYMVELYKKEIVSVLDGLDPNLDLVKADSSSMFFLKSLQKYGKINVEYIKENAELSRDMEEYIDTLNDYLDIVGKSYDLLEVALDIGPTLASFSRNYENGLLILKSVAEMSGNSSNPEYDTAMRQLIDEYSSKSSGILGILLQEALDNAAGSFDKFVSAVISKAITNGNVLYRVATLSIDIAMLLSGEKEIAENSLNFVVQVENYVNAQEAYRNAFIAVFNGDASSVSVSRLSIAFEYAKQSAINLYETMIKMTEGSEKTYLTEQLAEIKSLTIK